MAKRLYWDSCKRYDDEYVEKGEEETWHHGGCFPGWQKDYYIRQAKELLALARKEVNEEQDDPIRGMRPLRRGCRHILRDLPLLRIQAGRAQSATKGEMYGLTQVTTD